MATWHFPGEVKPTRAQWLMLRRVLSNKGRHRSANRFASVNFRRPESGSLWKTQTSCLSKQTILLRKVQFTCLHIFSVL